jgi:hypothetical protein
LLPLILLNWVYAYISIAFVLLLSCSVVIPPNLLLLFGGVTKRVKGTKFTQWMDLNKTNIDAKELKYIDLPTKYVWNKELKIWKKGKEVLQ